VAIENDMELQKQARQTRYADDLANPQRCRKRYLAAGEFVASFSHVLIAGWDHIDASNFGGTAAIVHARRNGVTPGLLPTTGYLPIPPDGPTLHIFAKREKRSRPEQIDPAKRQADPPWTIRWLFAFTKREHTTLAGKERRDDCDAVWQRAGLTRFTETCKLLNGFSERAEIQSVRSGISMTCSRTTVPRLAGGYRRPGAHCTAWSNGWRTFDVERPTSNSASK
jgi:hypothetical protein